jgi:radical SAM superfamily enzyme YgiQ (UPF0313 family)
MKKIKISTIQIGFDPRPWGESYLPYGAALLQTYTQSHAKNPEFYEFSTPIYRRVNVQEAVHKLKEADIAAFSIYVWNTNLSREIAKKLKKQNPNLLIVFGGPQIPDHPVLCEKFHRINPFVDLACHGEGESVFLEILEKYQTKNWKEIQSISYLSEDGKFIQNPKRSRLKNLSEIPSPYLKEIFLPMMRNEPDTQWTALWETNRGCPFSCSFCDWGGAIKSKIYSFDEERIMREIEWFGENRIAQVLCCDANFGILKRDLLIAKKMVETRQKYGYPKLFEVLNTKNATEQVYKIQKMLESSGMGWGVTISVQSLNPKALQEVRRENISLKSYHELQKRFTNDKINTYTDIIIGLPGETYDSFCDGISTLIENGQHNKINFFFLRILPNSEVGNPEYQKQHGLIIVDTKPQELHSSHLQDKEPRETYQTVVGTATMPPEDWIKTKLFCEFTCLLYYFARLLQIPFILLHECGSINYRELIELYMKENTDQRFPVIHEVQKIFSGNAREIQNGGEESIQGEKQYMNLWWTPYEFVYLKLLYENKLDDFYKESKILLQNWMKQKKIKFSQTLLDDGLNLSRALAGGPFPEEDRIIRLSYNIWEFFIGVLNGEKISLENKTSAYRVKWNGRPNTLSELIKGDRVSLIAESSLQPQLESQQLPFEHEGSKN